MGMKKTKEPSKVTNRAIAEAYGLSERSIARYNGRNIDLLDVEVAYPVISKGRRPKGLKPIKDVCKAIAKLKAMASKPNENTDVFKGVFGDEDLEAGADQALVRAKQLEVHLAKSLNTGRNVFDLYLNAIDRVRTLQLAKEKFDKETGELIPRHVMEELVCVLGLALRFAETLFLDNFADRAAGLDSKREIRQASKDLLYSKMETALTDGLEDNKFPAWLVDKFVQGYRE